MRSGYVSLIGRPNVGKSTLMNALIGQKIAITSDRPQTTRKKLETVYTDERGQIIFIDTPGIHKPGNKLGEYMDRIAEKTFADADVICWLVEPSTFIGAGEERIAGLLSDRNHARRPVILVINKVDTLKNTGELGEIKKLYAQKAALDDTVCVSSTEGTNLSGLLDVIYSYLPEGPLYYDEDTVTTMPMRSIAEELIREQALRFISKEIPHGMTVLINSFKKRKDGIFDIEADIICEKDSHKGIIIGKGGGMLKKIGTGARLETEALMGAKVNLRLFVKVRKNWRDSENMIRSYCYDAADLS